MDIERDLQRLDDAFDVTVVGGGISGVAIAREAAGRGLKVCLLEKRDFGAGTSSNTSKLLHGGLRYLQSFELGIVRESLRERKIFGCAAPHLVEPRQHVLPVYDWSRPGRAALATGLKLYDALAAGKNRGVPPPFRTPASRWLGPGEVRALAACLDPRGLEGGLSFYDFLNVHPERLLLAFVKTAARAGAVALNHVEARGIRVSGGRGPAWVEGVEARCALTGEERFVRSKVVVNAAGPWVDLVLRGLGRLSHVRVRRAKGIHLLTDPLEASVGLFARARSGRHLAISPWQGLSLLGPTDTAYEGHPDELRPLAEDVDELVSTANELLREPLAEASIRAVTVGARPLVDLDAQSTVRASRRSEIFDHRPDGVGSLYSVAGGKWTTSRHLGEQVFEALARDGALGGRRAREYDSSRLPLFGSPGFAVDPAPAFAEARAAAARRGLAPEVGAHLFRLYGTEHERVLALCDAAPALGERVSPRPGRLDILAQVAFGVRHESARTLSDLLDRRLVLGTMGPPTDDELRRVAACAGAELGWAAERIEAEVGRYRAGFLSLENVRRGVADRSAA
ncbi:MAG TPA: glycerol-3-phosphate dehydrogenase/oxidase [Polyangiaceae bacterium]|nr:glycerol-3-phosphate dehydrogenase/oxidase [Polyangiaceae bacterium]